MKRAGKEFDYLPQDFGVARFTVPEGRLIDRVKLDHVPIGDPCWVPGVTPRILFSAGDGYLYRYEFEESNARPFWMKPATVPEPSRWRGGPLRRARGCCTSGI